MEGYQKAIDILKQATTPHGFVAAVNDEDNYRRIWTRDSALCGLAALCTDDAELKSTFRRSIETIFKFQDTIGLVPSNVSVNTSNVSYGSAVGRIDNHAWIIISACSYATAQHNEDWLMQYKPSIDKIFFLMKAWEFNGRGLMYVPQSADWADEYHHHGYILYNQLLRLWALRSASDIFNDELYANEAEHLTQVIERFYSGNDFYAAHVKRIWGQQQFPYWVMGFNTSTLYTQFDLQANALTLFLKIGDDSSEIKLIEYIQEMLQTNDLMLPSFSPVISAKDPLMAELKNNYAFRFRNSPYEFHNGGLWPVWNGFLSSILSKDNRSISSMINARTIGACSQNNWEFNECYHGESNNPVGVSRCAWSAAGVILGYSNLHSVLKSNK